MRSGARGFQSLGGAGLPIYPSGSCHPGPNPFLWTLKISRALMKDRGEGEKLNRESRAMVTERPNNSFERGLCARS